MSVTWARALIACDGPQRPPFRPLFDLLLHRLRGLAGLEGFDLVDALEEPEAPPWFTLYWTFATAEPWFGARLGARKGALSGQALLQKYQELLRAVEQEGLDGEGAAVEGFSSEMHLEMVGWIWFHLRRELEPLVSRLPLWAARLDDDMFRSRLYVDAIARLPAFLAEERQAPRWRPLAEGAVEAFMRYVDVEDEALLPGGLGGLRGPLEALAGILEGRFLEARGPLLAGDLCEAFSRLPGRGRAPLEPALERLRRVSDQRAEAALEPSDLAPPPAMVAYARGAERPAGRAPRRRPAPELPVTWNDPVRLLEAGGTRWAVAANATVAPFVQAVVRGLI